MGEAKIAEVERSAKSYLPPVVPHLFTADPSARVFDGRLWLYLSTSCSRDWDKT